MAKLETTSVEHSRAEAETRYVRNRLDALLSRAIDTVEREGVTVDGKPHPMLAVIASLVSAGTDHRRLALERKAFVVELERR
jgi:hypothetical protein